jgi:[acyl-carrier-protein] S-malonyltransferase
MKAVRLEVAGAFHTRMMSSAAEALRNALRQAQIAAPGSIRTIVNITAEYYGSAEGIIDGLTRQLVSPILWQKCMERLLADGVEQFYEIGPGRVLTGLMKRINRKAKVTNVSDVACLKALIKGA